MSNLLSLGADFSATEQSLRSGGSGGGMQSDGGYWIAGFFAIAIGVLGVDLIIAGFDPQQSLIATRVGDLLDTIGNSSKPSPNF